MYEVEPKSIIEIRLLSGFHLNKILPSKQLKKIIKKDIADSFALAVGSKNTIALQSKPRRESAIGDIKGEIYTFNDFNQVTKDIPNQQVNDVRSKN